MRQTPEAAMMRKEVLAEGASFSCATQQKEGQINRALQNLSCYFAMKETIPVQLCNMHRGVSSRFQLARKQQKLYKSNEDKNTLAKVIENIHASDQSVPTSSKIKNRFTTERKALYGGSTVTL